MQSSLTKQPGTVIDDRYEIESLLGVGGMSSVYRVKDRKMNRVVALKMLHPHITETRGSAERFLQEAKAEGLIRDPNVIGVYAVSVTPEGHLYIVMDYLQGESLAELIKDGPLKDQSKALDLFVQTCRGLQAAHEKGVVHRDLKPSNVMLVDNGRTVKLVDFGIARLYSEHNAEQRLTKEGAVLGSPEYMSPEQCEGQTVDARSDIYSMGCLMYEMLTGRVPFDGDNQIEIMCKHVAEVPQPVSASAPWSAAGFDAVIAKCLEKDPTQRYTTVKELLNALEEVDAAQIAGAAPVAVTAKKRSTARGGKRICVAAGIVAISSIAFGAVSLMPQEPPHPAPPVAAVPVVTKPTETDEKLLAQIQAADKEWQLGKKAEATQKYDDVLIAFKQNPQLFSYTNILKELERIVGRSSKTSLDAAALISTKLLSVGRIGESRAVSNATADLASKHEEWNTQGDALVTLAKGDAALSEYDLTYDHAKTAVEAYKKAKPFKPTAYMKLSELVSWLFDSESKHLQAARIAELTYELATFKKDEAQAAKAAYAAGLSYLMGRDFEGTQKWYKKTLALSEKKLPQSDPKIFLTQCQIGIALQTLGRTAEAKRYYDMCRPQMEELARKQPGPETNAKLAKMIELYNDLGENKIAGKLQTLQAQ